MRQSGARSLAQERIGWCLIAVLSCLPAGAPRGRQSSWLGSCSGSRVSDRADRPRRVEPGDPLWPTPSTAAATAVMRGNKGRDTAPELALRSVLHRRGMRFRKRFTIRLGPRVLGAAVPEARDKHHQLARVNTASGCVQRRRPTRATGRRSSPATSLGTATPIAGWLRWAGRFCGLGSTRIRMPSQIASSGRCMNALRRRVTGLILASCRLRLACRRTQRRAGARVSSGLAASRGGQVRTRLTRGVSQERNFA